MKYTVLQISRGFITLMIRQSDELICWESRTFIPPQRMLLETKSIQEIIDLTSELIEVARLNGVPVSEMYAFRERVIVLSILRGLELVRLL